MKTIKKTIRERLLKNYSVTEIRKFPFIALLVALPLLNFCIWYVYVNFDSFRIAFSDNTTGEFTLSHFQKVFERFTDSDGYLRERLLRSLTTWAFNTFITFPVSIIYSFAIFKKIPFAHTFKVIFMIPTFLGGVVMIGLFKNLIGATGPVVSLLQTIGVSLPESVMKNGFLAESTIAYGTLLFYMFWMGMATNILLLSGAMARIPQDIFEAAKLDGISFIREMFQIVLPLIAPTLITMMVLSIPSLLTADAGTFTFYGASNPEGVATMGYELTLLTYLLAQTGGNAYGYPAALGLVLSAVAIPIALFTRKWLEKHVEAEEY